jgi:putative ABC transport system permease protein
MSTPRAYPFAVRLARREVRRRPWRTLLVALLVAGPVAAMVGADVLVRTEAVSPQREWQQQYGTADAVVHGPLPALPAGTDVRPFDRDYRPVRTAAHRRTFAEVTDVAPAAPVARGLYVHVSGRSPENAGEVVLSRRTARVLHVRVGDTVAFEKPFVARARVVGLAERASGAAGDLVVVAPGTRFRASAGARGYLVVLPATMSRAARLAWARSAGTAPSLKPGDGDVFLSPELAPPAYVPAQRRDRTSDVAFTWAIGAAVLAVVGIVIASAFAAGSRRQLTTLGQLAANGAGPRVLRRVLLLQGTWTGAAGAALGVAGGFGLLALLDPYRYDLLGRDLGPYHVHPLDLVPIVLIAVVTATVAALVPARTTARVPVLAALAGRRPLGAVPRWLAPVGAAVSFAGLALLALAILGATAVSSRTGPGSTRVWAVTGALGAVVVLLGACAVAPRYVSVLDRLAGRLHGAWRLAARSLARQRTRTAAVVSAVCATTALAVAAAALVLSHTSTAAHERPYVALNQVHVVSVAAPAFDAKRPPSMPAPVPEALADDVAAAVPDARRVDVPRLAASSPVRAAFVPARPGGDAQPPLDVTGASVATDEVLRLYGADARVRAALARDGAVAFDFVPGRITLPGALSFDVLPVTAYSLGALPPVLMTPAFAGRAGWAAAPPAVVLEARSALTEQQRNTVWAIYQDWSDEHRADVSPGPAKAPPVVIGVATPSSEPDPRAVEGLLATGALLFTVFFVGLSLALAAAETRDERDALAVVGAGTRVLRGTSGRKALLVTFLGALLGLPVGLAPVYVLTRVASSPPPFVVPWAVVALLVAVVPVVAAAVTTAASAVALRVRPVRVSTMAYE